MSDLTRLPLWPFILILGYPIVAIAVLEFGRRLTSRAPFTSGILRQVAYVLLPTGAMRLILRVLAGLPANDSAVRLAETAFALTGLYLLLHVAQAALTRLLDQQMRAPKLLRIGDGTIKYNVVLPVANPRVLDGPRDEFLSRFWYLAQRRGLRLDPSPAPGAAARPQMLERGAPSVATRKFCRNSRAPVPSAATVAATY